MPDFVYQRIGASECVKIEVHINTRPGLLIVVDRDAWATLETRHRSDREVRDLYTAEIPLEALWPEAYSTIAYYDPDTQFDAPGPERRGKLYRRVKVNQHADV